MTGGWRNHIFYLLKLSFLFCLLFLERSQFHAESAPLNGDLNQIETLNFSRGEE